MKVNKNIWVGKNKPYNRNSLYFPDGVNSGETTPAPPSGGESGSSNIEYLDVSGIDVPSEIPMLLGGLAKFTQTKYNSEELAYMGIADSYTMMKYSGYDGVMKITALAIQTGILDLPIKVTYLPTGEVTDEGVTKDVLDAGLGGFVTQVLNCPRITKEQFYNLE